MKHCGTQRLETERLILRRFISEDADAMYKNWASDDWVNSYCEVQTGTIKAYVMRVIMHC